MIDSINDCTIETVGEQQNIDTLSSAVPSCSFTYCWVRAANGEKDDLLVN